MNYEKIIRWVLLISALVYVWSVSFYFVLERRAEAACIREQFTGAHLSGLTVYCEMVYRGTSYIVPLSHIRELHQYLQTDGL